MHKRKGFTLIELLVVIAIIALLMSILMPALARARRQAKAAICRVNLHSWGIIFKMYSADWDEHFFAEWGVPPERKGWQWALLPYYSQRGVKGISTCPMAKKDDPSDPWGDTFITWGPWGLAYALILANSQKYMPEKRLINRIMAIFFLMRLTSWKGYVYLPIK